MAGISIRDLIHLAQRSTAESFAERVGSLILVGPEGQSEGRTEGWSYGTRHGREPKSSNPLADLLESVAFGLRKSKQSAFGKTILIGRAESNDVYIPDPSISKLHARLEIEGWLLSDAGSMNGTFVSEKQLERDQRVAIAKGSDLRFGDRPFRVHDAAGLRMMLSRFKF